MAAVRIPVVALALLLILAAPAAAAPDPSYRVAPAPPVEDQPAYFDSTSTSTSNTDPAIPVAIQSVQWDFGGGSNFEQSGDLVAHTYASAGAKTSG